MPYDIDLAQLSLTDYKALLLRRELLPGRRALLDEIDARFAALAACGVGSVAAMLQSLSTAQKTARFAAACGVDVAWLTLLRREAGSISPRPLPLAQLPGVDEARVKALAAQGIRDTRACWVPDAPPDDLLLCLCDLTRIGGVGALAARAFYEAGYPSVRAVAQADEREMLARVTAANERLCLYKAKLGLKDMRFCIDGAALLLRCGG